LHLSFGVLILQVFLLPLEIIDLCNEFFVLTHDSLVVSLVKLDVLFELLLETFDSRLKMCSFLDELSLLVDAFHLFLAFLLHVLSI
jgi:hypothetical protein